MKKPFSNSFRPSLEALEDRWMPSHASLATPISVLTTSQAPVAAPASVALKSGVLTIGDFDSVSIAQVGSRIQVTANGAVKTFDAKQVKQIKLLDGAGQNLRIQSTAGQRTATALRSLLRGILHNRLGGQGGGTIVYIQGGSATHEEARSMTTTARLRAKKLIDGLTWRKKLPRTTMVLQWTLTSSKRLVSRTICWTMAATSPISPATCPPPLKTEEEPPPRRGLFACRGTVFASPVAFLHNGVEVDGGPSLPHELLGLFCPQAGRLPHTWVEANRIFKPTFLSSDEGVCHAEAVFQVIPAEPGSP